MTNWPSIIADLMHEHRCSERSLSSAAKINRTTLRRILRGESSVRVDQLNLICNLFGYRLAVLPMETNQCQFARRASADADTSSDLVSDAPARSSATGSARRGTIKIVHRREREDMTANGSKPGAPSSPRIPSASSAASPHLSLITVAPTVGTDACSGTKPTGKPSASPAIAPASSAPKLARSRWTVDSIVTVNGKKFSLGEAAIAYGMPPLLVVKRMNKGWAFPLALTILRNRPKARASC